MNQKWLNWIIILGVITLAAVVIFFPQKDADSELAECIGKNSILYTHTGCYYCEQQKDLFGKNYEFLNIFNSNSWDELAKYNISATPTWVINGTQYSGIQSIEKLRELTRC